MWSHPIKRAKTSCYKSSWWSFWLRKRNGRDMVDEIMSFWHIIQPVCWMQGVFILSDFARYPPNIANVEKDVIAPYKHVVGALVNDSSGFDSRPTLMYFQGGIKRKDVSSLLHALYCNCFFVMFPRSFSHFVHLLSSYQSRKPHIWYNWFLIHINLNLWFVSTQIILHSSALVSVNLYGHILLSVPNKTISLPWIWIELIKLDTCGCVVIVNTAVSRVCGKVEL